MKSFLKIIFEFNTFIMGVIVFGMFLYFFVHIGFYLINFLQLSLFVKFLISMLWSVLAINTSGLIASAIYKWITDTNEKEKFIDKPFFEKNENCSKDFIFTIKNVKGIEQ